MELLIFFWWTPTQPIGSTLNSGRVSGLFYYTPPPVINLKTGIVRTSLWFGAHFELKYNTCKQSPYNKDLHWSIVISSVFGTQWVILLLAEYRLEFRPSVVVCWNKIFELEPMCFQCFSHTIVGHWCHPIKEKAKSKLCFWKCKNI